MWPFTRKKDPYVEVLRTRDQWSLDQKLIRWSKLRCVYPGECF